MRRSLIAAVPFVLLVPVAFGAAIVAAGYPIDAGALGVGALGWVIALALRTPVGLVGMRTLRDPERVQTAVVLSSGPLEEGVRVVALLIAGRDLHTALWLGLGWGAIEVLYAIANGFALAALASRTDAQAEQARAMLPPQAFSAAAPWWGIVERVFATALHLGFTLIVAALPLAVVATAVAHSAVNVGFMALIRRHSMALAMVAGLLIGAGILAIGLDMHGVLGPVT